jgi:hypothetical protein
MTQSISGLLLSQKADAGAEFPVRQLSAMSGLLALIEGSHITRRKIDHLGHFAGKFSRDTCDALVGWCL